MKIKFNWKAFFIALIVIGLMYLAIYIDQGLSSRWSIPLSIAFATAAGFSWTKQ